MVLLPLFAVRSYLKYQFTQLRSINLLLLILLAGCIESYKPDLSSEAIDIMVIDGSINASDKSASVILSHANALSNANEPLPEPNASVTIVQENGTSFKLTEQKSGTYFINELNLDVNARYQLHVLTKNGDEYRSDFVNIVKTPPIDSISWEPKKDGITIFANTHDSQENSKYYRWNFTETWEYHAFFASEYILVNRAPLIRNESQLIDKCYKTIPSTKIFIGSTERLTSGIISRYPLMFIPTASQKLSVRYSMLVKQKALSKEEYNYLQQLESTTERLGSLFDPQPSPVTGNIRNTKDNSIQVIGYFSAGFIMEKRIFIRFNDLPKALQIQPLRGNCDVPDTVCVTKPSPYGLKCAVDLAHLEGNPILLSALYDGITVIGYYKTTSECGDCRSQGGELKKPDFW